MGDWNAVIAGLPHQVGLRVGMTLFGVGLYSLVVRLLAITVRVFTPDRGLITLLGGCLIMRLAFLLCCCA